MPKRLKTEAHPSWINNHLYEAIYATETSEVSGIERSYPMKDLSIFYLSRALVPFHYS